MKRKLFDGFEITERINDLEDTRIKLEKIVYGRDGDELIWDIDYINNLMIYADTLKQLKSISESVILGLMASKAIEPRYKDSIQKLIIVEKITLNAIREDMKRLEFVIDCITDEQPI